MIVFGFVSIILFGIVAPTMLEPIAETFVQDQAVQDSPIAAQDFADSLLTSLLVYAPLLVLSTGVVSAVVWYFRRERVGRLR